ncbi:subtilisin-like protease SBT5.6 [Diospyros lotus]|uniref:subtilisin-like protease SBT5.6 n=1 Tax=Diospyros lotus TaxID=55363 RepID=UPI00224D5156|nr:subtilisin-like protease SBT5.6 [Diospyros lotus]
MKNYHHSLCSLILLLHLTASYPAGEHQAYIVYLGRHIGLKTTQEIEDAHHSYLLSVKATEDEAKASLIYSYKKVINGFSALLTSDEAAKLSEMEEVVSVFPGRSRSVQTTRSWGFVSLLAGGGHSTHSLQELWAKAGYGKDIIVGVLDTGIWPESQSFNDKGMEPIPKSWRGKCVSGVGFNTSNCNRKIIGARYYSKGFEAAKGPFKHQENYLSPRDKNGHGTHTASTIGGRILPNTSVPGGFAIGVATGGAPHARLAIYKVCWNIPGSFGSIGTTCRDEDILAAMDDAITDGVQVISISIGGGSAFPYDEDGTAAGALNAVEHNIVVVCSAGNSGPTRSTVTNVAPWILTVAASSIDRVFPSAVELGNGMTIKGQTITSFTKQKKSRLIFAGDAEIHGKTTNKSTGYCLPGTLSPQKVKGKVVICNGGVSANSLEVKRAGGLAVIEINTEKGMGIDVQSHVLPGTTIYQKDSHGILNYARMDKNPMAKLVPGKTVLHSKPAPFMAAFSSLGPSLVQPNILKPDITAPGQNILAAWSEAASLSGVEGDNRVAKYHIISGTSMACPHVSAVAALLKAIHPNWSSAAIRSAIMTTATLENNVGKPITDATGKQANPFNYGSGHFQPSKAADPGLVYDATYNDYIAFLCSSGYSSKISLPCPRNPPSPNDLNYPSVSISNLNGSMTVTRIVTNVGRSKSVYSLTVESPMGYSVEIIPRTLSFSQLMEKKKFLITIAKKGHVGKNIKKGEYAFGWYMWSDGIYTVRSPIAVASA